MTILRQPEFDFHRTVWVAGEIRFPGPDALLRKDERLTDLVERAGGGAGAFRGSALRPPARQPAERG